MPHQCTECGRAFPDGSKEMLSGCPDCGGNKFQFKPSGDADDHSEADAASPDPPDRSGVADRVGRATATVKRWVSGGDDPTPTRGETTSTLGENSGTSAGTPTTDTDADPTPTGGASADTRGDQTDTAASASAAEDGPVTDRDDDRAYGEWPNPDGADTAGVGKGPEARRTRSPSDDDTSEWPDTDGESRPDASGESRPDASGRSRPGASEEPRPDASEQSRPDSDSPSAPDPDDAAEVAADSDEDSAQASARSDVVSRDELPESSPDSGTLGPRQPTGSTGRARGGTGVPSTGPVDDPGGTDGVSGMSTGDTADHESPPETTDGRVAREPTTDEDDRPDLEDLREELNDQFESIKIVEPGQYELNLMELYDREEYIISLQEDGRYVIEVPERWRDED